jgi:hypothetical protein
MLLLKKLEIEETKTTKYSTLKTDVLKVGLVFSISNFFINKKFMDEVLALAAVIQLYSSIEK